MMSADISQSVVLADFGWDFRQSYAKGFACGAGNPIIDTRGFFVTGESLLDKFGKISFEQIRESRRKL